MNIKEKKETKVSDLTGNACPVCGCRETMGIKCTCGEKLAVCQGCGVPRVVWDDDSELKIDPTKPEPAPKKGQINITAVVIEDLKSRDLFGKNKYGTTLKSHNGRDALMDAYQEALDLLKYIRQEIAERDGA